MKINGYNISMRFVLLPVFALVLSLQAHGRNCDRYVFDFMTEYNRTTIGSGDIRISWSLNPWCGPPSEDLSMKIFEVKIVSIFDDPIASFTIKGNFFIIDQDLIKGEKDFLVTVIQPQEKESVMAMLRLSEPAFMAHGTSIDSVNHLLQAGYFLNALSILQRLGRNDLISWITEEYMQLFPNNYAPVKNCFNFCLLDDSVTLQRMPYVKGIGAFERAINKSLSAEKKKPSELHVRAEISPEGQILAVDVMPGECQLLVYSAIENLRFSNPNDVPSTAVLILTNNRNGSKLYVVNYRALMDPSSPEFKTYLTSAGAVHR